MYHTKHVNCCPCNKPFVLLRTNEQQTQHDVNNHNHNAIIQDGGYGHLSSSLQEVLMYSRMLTDDMASLRTQVTNLKYDNHLLYKQVRRPNHRDTTRCDVTVAISVMTPLSYADVRPNDRQKH